jgi:hypothetical protein
LSAATDRLPVAIQAALLDWLKPGLGALWRSLLVDRDYVLPYSKYKYRIRYAVGQPMGAYSSWAMLALTHHFLVQYAAWKMGHRVWFDRYMVLGDDIVIWDDRVSSAYTGIVSQLGVEISPTKSIISREGGAEFAKRYLVKGVDASPVSLAEVQVASGSLEGLKELAKRHASSVKPGDVATFQGRGYKSKSKMTGSFRHMSRSLMYMLLFLMTPGTSAISVANYFEWFDALSVSKRANGAVVNYLSPLAEWISDKLPISIPRLGNMDYVSAILGLSQTFLNSQCEHKGHGGSVDFLNYVLEEIFRDLANDLVLEDAFKLKTAKKQFVKREYPLSPSGVDQVMADLNTFQPEVGQYSAPYPDVDVPPFGYLSRKETLSDKDHFSVGVWFRMRTFVRSGRN